MYILPAHLLLCGPVPPRTMGHWRGVANTKEAPTLFMAYRMEKAFGGHRKFQTLHV